MVSAVTKACAQVLDAGSALEAVLDEMPYDRLERLRGRRAQRVSKDLEVARSALITALGILRSVQRRQNDDDAMPDDEEVSHG